MTWRDTVCHRRRQALERIGLNRGWFRELSAYHPGLTLQEFWIEWKQPSYGTIGRARGETDCGSFFAETEYSCSA